MASLVIKGVTKSFGPLTIIPTLDLSVVDGELCVLVGPSGCGKSTLLRIIAGLEPTSSGHVLIDGIDVTRTEPSQRGIAMVFQSYALYPHMNVGRNMGFALEIAGLPRSDLIGRVAEAAGKLRLDAYLRRKPRELSGGQRQRVAIGRAITRRPKIFLLDEPLSNLDAALRVGMRVEIARLKAELGATMVYVTHDQVEAMTLADRIVVMDKGRIEQVAPPLELYQRPANLFVARFIGSPAMNLLPGHVTEQANGQIRLRLDIGVEFVLSLSEVLPADAPVTIGIRPEHIRIGNSGGPSVTGEAAIVEHLGSDTFAHLQVGNHILVVRDSLGRAMQRGSRVAASWSVEDCHVFGADGARLE